MNHKMVNIMSLVLGLILGLIIGSARVYNGLNYGVAWNRGGIEITPSLSLFLCAGDYNPVTQETHYYHIPEIFESLVTDC